MRRWLSAFVCKRDGSDTPRLTSESVVVQILKQDWPHKWKSFIPDIVGASRTSETLCENCMVRLWWLSRAPGCLCMFCMCCVQHSGLAITHTHPQ